MRSSRFLAAARLVCALAVFAFFVYVYLSRSLAANGFLAVLVKNQFSPALYTISIAALAFLALTLLFGRVFCSVCCPCGSAQELIWRMGNFFRRKKRNSPAVPRPMGHSSPKRYLIPLAAGLGALFMFFPPVILSDPLSTFGRGLSAIRGVAGNNETVFGLVIAVPFVIIAVIAFFRGRPFCSWCPVGITLGLVSRFSLVGLTVSHRCVSCGRCEKTCPVRCINAVEKQIDSERCILCFSCAAVCPHGSVQYGLRIRPAGAPKPAGRRIFLKQAGAIVCGAVYLAAPGLRRLLFARSLPAGTYPAGLILPPGAESPDHYFSRCIACHACVAACPVGVLKPVRAPQPALDYTHAGCQFTCTECGKVCPAGAIHHLSADEKQRTRIALSALVFERCVVNIKRESCGACAEVCPTGALTMISYTESGIAYLTRPVFDERYCIGCGVCLSACPAEPRALAITAAEKQSLTAGARPAEELGDELHIADTETFPF